jgi:predicted nucleic acid-binding protein
MSKGESPATTTPLISPSSPPPSRAAGPTSPTATTSPSLAKRPKKPSTTDRSSKTGVTNISQIADTSALYALFDEDDTHHEQARQDLSTPTPVTIPSKILVETVNLLEYRSTWETAQRALDHLLDQPHISVANTVPTDGVLQVFANAEGQLSLADATVVQTPPTHARKPLAYANDRRRVAYDNEIADALSHVECPAH